MRYLALLMIGWLALPVYALTQVDIYRAEVAIDAEKSNGEELARQQAMQQVIVRASGSVDSVNNPVVSKALQASSRYISQLSYGKLGEQTSVKLLFNSAQIRALLTQAQLPFWSENRNNLLVWLVEEQNYDRAIVWEHSGGSVVDGLKSAARERGLPLTMPIGDFDDITGIAISDLWGGFVQPISRASQRYPVDGVLVIRAQGNQLRWSLYDQPPEVMETANQVPMTGSANGENATATLINTIADFYAKRSAVLVSGESSQSVVVKFLNINNAIDFFSLEKALTALNSVASLDILKIKGNELTLRVHLLASQAAFEKEAEQLPHVVKFDDPLSSPVEEETLDSEPAALSPEVGAAPSTQITLPAQDISVTETVAEPLSNGDPLVYEWQGRS